MRAWARALVAVGLSAALPAAALDRFEIQVYEDAINAPGQPGVELHANYTAEGAKEPAYPGEIPPDHSARFTLEPAIGIAPWLELGAYVQLLVAPSTTRWAGAKVRAKMVAPPLLGDAWFLGVNVELAYVPPEVEQDQWSNELRPFLGWRNRWLLVDLNPILGWSLQGPDAFRVAFEPALKVALDTQVGFAVGVEYYADVGFLNDVRPLDAQAHYLFGVVDLVPGAGRPSSPWEVNLGVGGGVTGGADQQLVIKAILGRSF